MPISRQPIRHTIGKERFYLCFSVLAALFAGYGALRFGQAVFGEPRGYDSLSPLLALVVFIGALFLMLRGIDAIRDERHREELKQRLLDESIQRADKP